MASIAVLRGKGVEEGETVVDLLHRAGVTCGLFSCTGGPVTTAVRDRRLGSLAGGG